jgi:hypothetical protein
MKKIVLFLTLLIYITLPLISQENTEYVVRYNKISYEPASLKTIADRFDAVINAKLLEIFSDKLKAKGDYVNRDINVYDINLRLNDSFLLDYTVTNKQNTIFTYSFSFDYNQKDSLLNYIIDQLIPETAKLISTAQTDPENLTKASNELQKSIDNYSKTTGFEQISPKITAIITPQFEYKNPNDSYYDNLVLTLSVTDYLLKITYNDDWSEEFDVSPPGFQEKNVPQKVLDYIRSLQPEINVLDKENQWIKRTTLKADNKDTEFRVKYSVNGPDTDKSIVFELAPPTELNYKINSLPEYKFSTESFKLDSASLSLYYKPSDFIVIPSLIDPKNSVDALLDYLYINEDIAKFLNDHNGNLILNRSMLFNFDLSIVKTTDEPQLQQALGSPQSERNVNLFSELKYLNENSMTMLQAEGSEEANLPTIKELIDIIKCDYYIKIKFNNNMQDTDSTTAIVKIADLARKGSASGLPVSNETADAITGYFSKYLKNSKENYLDMARILFFMGKSAEAVEYIGKFDQSLSTRTRRSYETVIQDLKKYKSAFLPADIIFSLTVKDESNEPQTDIFHLDSEQFGKRVLTIPGIENGDQSIIKSAFNL